MFGLTRRDWLAIIAVAATLGVGFGLLEEATGLPALYVGTSAGAVLGVLVVWVARRRTRPPPD